MSRMPDPAQLDKLFFALSDSNRRTMLEHLSTSPRSVSELGEPLGIALPSVVKHLAVLESGGLVASRKIGRVRTYRMTPNAFADMEKWLATRKAQINQQFDRLEAYLAAEKAKGG